MKWGGFDLNWGRPLKSILAVFDKKKLIFDFHHLTSSNSTFIDKEYEEKKKIFTNFKEYNNFFKKINIIIDQEQRKNLIETIEMIDDNLVDIENVRNKRNSTDIVIVGSTASLKGYDNHSVYCATKHAVDGFIKSLQAELKNEPVRVIGFHPGGFNSNLRHGIIKEGYMEPKDLAKLVLNLLDLPKSMEVSKIVINRKKEK